LDWLLAAARRALQASRPTFAKSYGGQASRGGIFQGLEKVKGFFPRLGKRCGLAVRGGI
jgi:hypothetical protein